MRAFGMPLCLEKRKHPHSNPLPEAEGTKLRALRSAPVDAHRFSRQNLALENLCHWFFACHCDFVAECCARHDRNAQRRRDMRGACVQPSLAARLPLFDNRIDTAAHFPQNSPKFPISKKSSQLRRAVETEKPKIKPKLNWAIA